MRSDIPEWLVNWHSKTAFKIAHIACTAQPLANDKLTYSDRAVDDKVQLNIRYHKSYHESIVPVNGIGNFVHRERWQLTCVYNGHSTEPSRFDSFQYPQNHLRSASGVFFFFLEFIIITVRRVTAVKIDTDSVGWFSSDAGRPEKKEYYSCCKPPTRGERYFIT